MRHSIHNAWNDLNATAPNAYDGNSLATEVGVFVVVCRVTKLAFESPEAFNIGPVP